MTLLMIVAEMAGALSIGAVFGWLAWWFVGACERENHKVEAEFTKWANEVVAKFAHGLDEPELERDVQMMTPVGGVDIDLDLLREQARWN